MQKGTETVPLCKRARKPCPYIAGILFIVLALAAMAGAEDSTKVDSIIVKDGCFILKFSENDKELIGVIRNGDTIYFDEMDDSPIQIDFYVDPNPIILGKAVEFIGDFGGRPMCDVIVEFVIDTTGDVLPNSARVIRAKPEGIFEDEALDSVYTLKFTPGEHKNRVSYRQSIKFRPEDAEPDEPEPENNNQPTEDE